MIVEKTQLDGVLKIKLDAFEDHRGWYVETYNEQKYHEAGIDIKFVEDDISVTRKNCLKGVHGDQNTWKLISCLHGSFYLPVVNNDPTHEQYRQWQGFTLSDRNNLQILVPAKFGNGHIAFTEYSIYNYKQSYINYLTQVENLSIHIYIHHNLHLLINYYLQVYLFYRILIY